MYGTAIGESEFVSAERGNASRVCGCRMIEEVARVKRRVAHKLKKRAVKAGRSGASDDVCETRRPTADISRHPTRTRLQFLNGVYVEVRHDAATHLRIADVRTIHGKSRFHAALSVDCKLLGEIRRAVCIGHSAGRQEQQGTEVTAVQR